MKKSTYVTLELAEMQGTPILANWTQIPRPTRSTEPRPIDLERAGQITEKGSGVATRRMRRHPIYGPVVPHGSASLDGGTSSHFGNR